MTKQQNILIVMADQLSALALGCYGNATVHSPHIDRLAANGVLFESAYCNSPLCAPARFAMMSGRHISRCGGYDNAAYWPSTMPTFAHYLRLAGYQTCLSGKMHFVGADQLHGFERRLTTDIYPADFGWVPDWRNPQERIDLWYHNMSSVQQAGVAAITNQLAYDDEVGARAIGAIHDHARGDDARPLCLVVGFIHPHDPYAARRKHWALYDDIDIPLPRVGALPDDQQDAHSRRLARAIGADQTRISDEQIRRARRAYFANVSYIDEWLGKFIDALTDCDMANNTDIIFTSDHGDMLGERGLWYKMSFMEWSSRVPLIIARAGDCRAVRVQQPASLVDLLPTLLDFADSEYANQRPPIDPLDGRSLAGYCNDDEVVDKVVDKVSNKVNGKVTERVNGEHNDAVNDKVNRNEVNQNVNGNVNDKSNDEFAAPVIGEYLAEATAEPMLMIRSAHYKYITCQGDADLLFDLRADPDELRNLAADPAHRALMQQFTAAATDHWDAQQVKREVLASQRRRREVHAALSIGARHSWDYNPPRNAAEEYTRSHMELSDFDARARYPRPRAIVSK